MTEFEKELIIRLSELLGEKDSLQQEIVYWKTEVGRLNNLYEKLTNDYITLSKSIVNG